MLSAEKRDRLRQAVVTAMPIILGIVGVVLLGWGYSLAGGDASALNRQKLLYTIGSAVLSGGIFASVLKSFQFLGIFQEAMENIVFSNQRWLGSLSDARLRTLWSDATQAIVTKGFPRLSASLGKEVLDEVIPKLGDYYYTKMFRRLELVGFDTTTGVLEMAEEYELAIHAYTAETEIPYKFGLRGNWASQMPKRPAEIRHLTINGKDQISSVAYSGKQGEHNNFRVSHDIKLKGEASYSVRRHMTRLSHLPTDPIVLMVTTRFAESMVLMVVNRLPEIRVRIETIGLADSGYAIRPEGPTIQRCDVHQLMFPGDGVLLVLERIA